MSGSRSSEMFVFVGGANAGKRMRVESDKQYVQLQTPKEPIQLVNSSPLIHAETYFEIEVYTKRTLSVDRQYVNFFAHASLNELQALTALLNGYRTL